MAQTGSPPANTPPWSAPGSLGLAVANRLIRDPAAPSGPQIAIAEDISAIYDRHMSFIGSLTARPPGLASTAPRRVDDLRIFRMAAPAVGIARQRRPISGSELSAALGVGAADDWPVAIPGAELPALLRLPGAPSIMPVGEAEPSMAPAERRGIRTAAMFAFAPGAAADPTSGPTALPVSPTGALRTPAEQTTQRRRARPVFRDATRPGPEPSSSPVAADENSLSRTPPAGGSHIGAAGETSVHMPCGSLGPLSDPASVPLSSPARPGILAAFPQPGDGHFAEATPHAPETRRAMTRAMPLSRASLSRAAGQVVLHRVVSEGTSSIDAIRLGPSRRGGDDARGFYSTTSLLVGVGSIALGYDPGRQIVHSAVAPYRYSMMPALRSGQAGVRPPQAIPPTRAEKAGTAPPSGHFPTALPPLTQLRPRIGYASPSLVNPLPPIGGRGLSEGGLFYGTTQSEATRALIPLPLGFATHALHGFDRRDAKSETFAPLSAARLLPSTGARPPDSTSGSVVAPIIGFAPPEIRPVTLHDRERDIALPVVNVALPAPQVAIAVTAAPRGVPIRHVEAAAVGLRKVRFAGSTDPLTGRLFAGTAMDIGPSPAALLRWTAPAMTAAAFVAAARDAAVPMVFASAEPRSAAAAAPLTEPPAHPGSFPGAPLRQAEPVMTAAALIEARGGGAPIVSAASQDAAPSTEPPPDIGSPRIEPAMTAAPFSAAVRGSGAPMAFASLRPRSAGAAAPLTEPSPDIGSPRAEPAMTAAVFMAIARGAGAPMAFASLRSRSAGAAAPLTEPPPDIGSPRVEPATRAAVFMATARGAGAPMAFASLRSRSAGAAAPLTEPPPDIGSPRFEPTLAVASPTTTVRNAGEPIAFASLRPQFSDATGSPAGSATRQGSLRAAIRSSGEPAASAFPRRPFVDWTGSPVGPPTGGGAPAAAWRNAGPTTSAGLIPIAAGAVRPVVFGSAEPPFATMTWLLSRGTAAGATAGPAPGVARTGPVDLWDHPVAIGSLDGFGPVVPAAVDGARRTEPRRSDLPLRVYSRRYNRAVTTAGSGTTGAAPLPPIIVARAEPWGSMPGQANLPPPPDIGTPVPAAVGSRDDRARGAAPHDATADVDEIIERAWREVMSRLAIEQERRGFGRWS